MRSTEVLFLLVVVGVACHAQCCGTLRSHVFRDSLEIVDLKASCAPFPSVIEELERQTGEEITFAPGLAEKEVTLELHGAPFWLALQVLCAHVGGHFDMGGSTENPCAEIREGAGGGFLFFGGPYAAWSGAVSGKRRSWKIAWEQKLWPPQLRDQVPHFAEARFAVLAGDKASSPGCLILASRRHLVLEVEDSESPIESILEMSASIGFSLPSQCETLEFPLFGSQPQTLSNGVGIYLKIDERNGPGTIRYHRLDVGLARSDSVDLEVEEWAGSRFDFFEPPTVELFDRRSRRCVTFQGAQCLTVPETWRCYGYLLAALSEEDMRDLEKIRVHFAMAPVRERLELRFPSPKTSRTPRRTREETRSSGK